MAKLKPLLRTAVPAALSLALAAPALAAPEKGAVNDPLEGLNRAFYAVHRVLDAILFRPLAMVYSHVLPQPVRTGLRNAVDNVDLPVVFANDVLQARPKQAVRTAGRFAFNSSFGFGGLFDPATGAGLPRHDNDFGLTLARYHVGAGPYLFLPLLGPSSLRDTVGQSVDVAFNPLTYARFKQRRAIGVAEFAIRGIDERAKAEPDLVRIDQQNTDPYAAMRSLYLQDREAKVHPEGVGPDTLPDIDLPMPTAPSSETAPMPPELLPEDLKPAPPAAGA